MNSEILITISINRLHVLLLYTML